MKSKFSHSVQTQTIASCVLLGMLIFAVTAGGMLRFQLREGKNTLVQALDITADKKALELDFSLLGIEEAVYCAQDYILRTLDEERILHDKQYEKRYMAALAEEMFSLTSIAKDAMALYFRMNVEKYGGTTGIFLGGDTEQGFVSVKPTDLLLYEHTDVEHVGWYYIPLWKKAPVWIPPYENRNLGCQMISFVIPIYKDGDFLGVVGMDINLATIKNIIDTLPVENELAVLLAEDYSLVYFSNAHLSQNSVEHSANISAIRDIFSDADGEALTTYTWGGEAQYGVMRKLKNGMSLFVSVTETAMRIHIMQVLSPLCIAFGVAVLLTALVVSLAVKNLIAPLHIISGATFKLARGELGIHIPYQSKNELGQLANNIRMMISQMQEYIAHIREQTKKERANREAAEAQSKNKSEFLASMYLSMHEIDLAENTFRPVASHQNADGSAPDVFENADELFPQMMKALSGAESLEALLSFTRLSDLNERMGKRISISQEFKASGGIWCRGRFIAMDRNADGSLRRVVWAVENIHEERAAREKLQKEADTIREESLAKSAFLASMYLSLHEVDLNTDTFSEVTSTREIAKNIGNSFDHARATIRRVMEDRVANQGQARKDFMDFINFDTLEERLKGRITIAQEFYSILGYWCRARFIVMDRNKDGTLHRVLWAVENIGEERALREKLEGEVAKSVAASQAKSAFLANMSHEIRTPINAVLGMDEMILRECEDSNILGYAANIKTAGANLLAIVNDILDFSKIEAGKMELLPENYDISSVVVDLVNMISERAKKKDLEFILQTEPTLPKTLYGDSVRIKQCALNLLTNAVKYTQKGSVVFTVGYRKLDEHRITLNVTVEDTGSGIKKEDMEKLFSPFERIEEGRNKTIEGTGLGMSIVKKMLSMMGTKLDVQSEYGRGSVFSFAVEQQVIDWTAVGDINETYRQSLAQMAQYREKLHAPKAHLLFVDDTEMNLEVIKGLLKKTGMKIDTALSGEAALEKVAENTYDILFIDHRMPGMDGIQTLHAMQTLHDNKSAGKPCIALTANAIAGVKQMYLDEGFTDYLSKPVNPDKLEDMIRKYLPPDYLEEWLEAVDDEDAESADDASGTFLSQFRAVTGVDADAALANCGTGELLEATVKKYYATIDEKAAELSALLAGGDIENYGTKVHALKSTSRLIGAMELSSLAEHLEHAADAGDTAEIQAKHGSLMELFLSYKQHLAPLAASGETGSQKPAISAEELSEKLTKLSACADSFDIDGLDALVADLSAVALPPDFADTFAQIRTCVENVDFAGLKALIRKS